MTGASSVCFRYTQRSIYSKDQIIDGEAIDHICKMKALMLWCLDNYHMLIIYM